MGNLQSNICLMLAFHKGLSRSFSRALFILYINNHPNDVVCNIATYADDATLYSKCDQASDHWQEPKLVAELESNL